MTFARKRIKGAEESTAKTSSDLHTLQARIADIRISRSGCLDFTGTDFDQYAKLERLEKARLAGRRALFRKLVRNFD